MTPELAAWSRQALADVDATLDTLFGDAWPAPFAEPLRYPLFGGGKRVRPLLTLAAAEAVASGDRGVSLPAAAAVELVHTYSLVHDDLPAMDDDNERRGRPTVHVAFGEDRAILVGDALLTEAFAVLARAPLSAETRIGLVAELAEAAGYRGMVGGQAADVGVGGKVTEIDTLLKLHAGKTGALIRAAVVMGGMAAGADADTLARLRTYGEAVGLAFQLADDVLDADQDEGDDGPPSYVKLLGADETLRRAKALADEAIAAVTGLPKADALIGLARFTVEREV